MGKVKPTKTEQLILAMTAVFLCGLLSLFCWERASAAGGVFVETEMTVSAENILPERAFMNINTATAKELATLPGIGDTLAGRIVAYRTEHGDFAETKEIMQVNGVGEGKFSAVADRITVE